MYVMSEINDPSKEVKVRFMKKSGQHILLGKKVGKVVPKVSNISQMLHTIPSIDNPMGYSFDTIDIKSRCDKIKTLDRDFKMDLHIHTCSRVSHKLLMYPIEDNCCER